MIPISDQHLGAHEREQLKRRDALALQWYRRQGGRLPQPPEEDARGILERAKESAKEIGLLDVEEDRLRRLMAFHALMPQHSDEQWLLGVDIVFDVEEQMEAVGALRRLSGVED